MPFGVQYVFNPKCGDLTVETFDNAYNAFKCNNQFGSFQLAAKGTLSPEELKVFDILEAREFKVCLLKLAKIFREQSKLLRQIPMFQELFGSNNLSVRLINENLIILRDGPFDYFEINLDQELEDEFAKFGRELSEFVSVLETMGTLSLVSGDVA